MHLRLPYVQIWNILHFDFSGSTPIALYSWQIDKEQRMKVSNSKGIANQTGP
jgi:hypothetical protein